MGNNLEELLEAELTVEKMRLYKLRSCQWTYHNCHNTSYYT